MIIAILTPKLVNGLCKVVKALNEDGIEVYFDTIEKIVKVSQNHFCSLQLRKGSQCSFEDPDAPKTLFRHNNTQGSRSNI